MQENHKELYKVTSVNQLTGDEIVGYVATDSLAKIEDEVSDILKIEVMQGDIHFEILE